MTNSLDKLKQIDDKQNIRFGVILSYMGMAVSILGALFVSNKVLDFLGDYNYGLYSFVTSITTWLTVVSNALNASFLRYATQEAVNNKGNVGRTNSIYFRMLSILGLGVVVIGCAVLGILYASHTCIGKYDWNDSRLMYLLFAISILNIGLTMPASIFSLYVTYRKKFVFAKAAAIIVSVITFAGQFLLAYFTRSIVAIAAFTVVITIVRYCGNSYFCRRYLNINFAKVSLKENRQLIHSICIFSGILLFNSIVDQINSNVDKTLLGIFSTPEDVTLYQMAHQLSATFTTFSVSVSGVFAPTAHELVARRNTAGINRLYLKISSVQSVILCCVAFGFLSCGRNFIIWWIGEERVTSYYVAAALMLVSTGPLTMNSSIEIQRAEDRHLFRAVVYFALALANVLLSILFLKLFDSEYAIYACLAGTVITTICSHWIAMNIYNRKVIGLPVGKYLMALTEYMLFGLVGYVAVLICNRLFINDIKSIELSFLVQGTVFLAVYMLIVLTVNRKQVKDVMDGIKGRRCKS